MLPIDGLEFGTRLLHAAGTHVGKPLIVENVSGIRRFDIGRQIEILLRIAAGKQKRSAEGRYRQ